MLGLMPVNRLRAVVGDVGARVGARASVVRASVGVARADARQTA